MELKKKYSRPAGFSYREREWPDKQLEKAPRWCSVDLRDGNQALPMPMSVEQKLDYFKLLCRMGFKEIELGFPTASAIEHDFIKKLIDEKRIPEDIVPQMLTQCRSNLIAGTMELLAGLPKAIVHIYCSTSPLQRRVVFRMDRDEVLNLALSGVRDVAAMCRNTDCLVSLEFSPEHFNETELDFSKRICEAVAEQWLPAQRGELILNLPATVEYSSPNVFADQVEWMHRNLSCRNDVILSVHAHNDRGCAVASSELALLAGADRVEGTLFGNGERTGNVDLVNLAGNLMSQGIAPGLDISRLPEISHSYEELTGMKLSPRVPYAGQLVFTAFSGSHQDAINKGKRASSEDRPWQVPYLLVDPADLGRVYEPVVRINSQSGKGGLDYVLRSNYGIALPKPMLADFAFEIQRLSEADGELLPEQIYTAFQKRYVLNQKKIMFSDIKEAQKGLVLRVLVDGEPLELSLAGVKPEDELCAALEPLRGVDTVTAEVERCRLDGQCGRCMFFAAVKKRDGGLGFGAALGDDGPAARLKALISAINGQCS